MFREPWGRITKRRANDTSFGIRKKQLKLLESFSWTSKLNYIDTYGTKNNFSTRKTMEKNNSTQYKLLLWNNGTNERSGINFNWYRKSSHTFIYVWENLIFPLLDIKLNRVLKVICMTLLWLLQHLFASCVPIFSPPFLLPTSSHAGCMQNPFTTARRFGDTCRVHPFTFSLHPPHKAKLVIC